MLSYGKQINNKQFILTRFYFIVLIKESYMIKFHNIIPQEEQIKTNSSIDHETQSLELTKKK